MVTACRHKSRYLVEVVVRIIMTFRPALKITLPKLQWTEGIVSQQTSKRNRTQITHRCLRPRFRVCSAFPPSNPHERTGKFFCKCHFLNFTSLMECSTKISTLSVSFS